MSSVIIENKINKPKVPKALPHDTLYLVRISAGTPARMAMAISPEMASDVK